VNMESIIEKEYATATVSAPDHRAPSRRVGLRGGTRQGARLAVITRYI
jgi:hypothetical protein